MLWPRTYRQASRRDMNGGCRVVPTRSRSMVSIRVLCAMTTVSLVITLGSTPRPGEGQPTAKVPSVGLLRPGSPPDPYIETFRRALQDLGYVEGQSIALEYRWAEGR